MTVCIMGIDECGDEFRAHGTEFLEGEYTFPNFDEDDEAMSAAYFAWRDSLTERANKEWAEIYGPECRLFIEETHESVFRRSHFHGL